MTKKKEEKKMFAQFGGDGIRRFGDTYDHGRFYDAFVHSIGTYKASLEDGSIQWREYRHMAADVMDTGATFLVAIGEDDEKYGELVTDMEDVVKEFVTPYDLPFVAPWLEKFVDQQLEGNVRGLLDLARSVLVQKEE